MINLLHYDDAARSALASLVSPKSKQEIFLVSDEQPLNYLEVCQTAKKHDLYADKDVPDFKGNDDKSGKIYDGTKISSMLQWNPKFKNFEVFLLIFILFPFFKFKELSIIFIVIISFITYSNANLLFYTNLPKTDS